MRPLTVLGAAALLASALTLPAMAQEVIRDPGRCAQFHPDANCQNYGPGNPYRNSYSRRHHAVYRTSRTAQQDARNQDTWNQGTRNRDTWNNGYRGSPGEVAAGAVGTAGAVAVGAANTAGAIATAPLRGSNSYGYYNGGDNNGRNNGGWSGQSYAERNGFVCTPGQYFKGEDGRRHPCQ